MKESLLLIYFLVKFIVHTLNFISSKNKSYVSIIKNDNKYL